MDIATNMSTHISVPTSLKRESKPNRSEQTRLDLLDAAAVLFAQKPYADVTLRMITQKAGSSLAAVNYHFGSKELMLKEVFFQRARQLNRERLMLLAEAESRSLGQCVPLEDVLYAYLAPAIGWIFLEGDNRKLIIKFLARYWHVDSILSEEFIKDTKHLSRFVSYLHNALPKHTIEDVHWGFHFVVGALHYTISDLARLDALSNGSCKTSDRHEVTARLLEFAKAGMLSAMKDRK